MGGKIRKLFSIIFTHKKVLFLSLGLVFFLSLVPFHFAQANIFSDIFWGIITLPMKMSALFVAIPLLLLALVAAILYFIFIVILGWLKVIALSVPVIPAKVGVVMEGWTITQNLANLFLILILVFIGLATILRLREYEAKKLLPTLILVALLINFSPVLVGFVVDISNIVSNFFLNLATFDSVKEVFGIVWNYFLNVLSIVVKIGPLEEIIGYIIGTIILGVVIVLFFGYAVWIFFLVVGLLIVRIIYLWVLMILAPIAFLSKIFPAKGTPKMLFPGILHWDEWWKELIQWSIIAIPIGFFLFLSFKVLAASAALQGFFRTPDLSGGVAGTEFDGVDWGAGAILGDLSNVLGLILAPLLSLILLHIGYNLSRKNMPTAAQGIISGIEKGMKMVAGTALVAATGGAAAGLVAKGLGGMAKGAKGLESTLGRVPLAGKTLKYGVGKPVSWATRGMERAAAPTLLEYQAKTRRVPEGELKKIEGMSGPEAEAYIKAKTSMLPEGLRKRHRSQYQARMAEKETLEFTSSGFEEDGTPRFQEEAKENARSIFKKEDPHYQKEAMAIAKNLPDVFEGAEGEEAYAHMKMIGKTGPARAEAEREAREEIKKTKDEIRRRISSDDATIEVGLKLAYITKDEVDKDRAAALAKAKVRVTTGEITKFLDDAVATAGAATFVKELKPEDMRKMANPDNLGTRVGLTLGNPRNLQRIQDHFGHKKLRGVIEGTGGLNSATNTPEKLDEFAKNVNPAMARAIFRSPAYQEIDIEARKHMRDLNDQPTTNPDVFERRIEVQKKLEKAPPTELLDPEAKISDAEVVEKHSSEENLVALQAQIKERETKITKLKEGASSLEGSLKDEAEQQLTQLEEELSFYKDIVELRKLKEKGVRRTAEEQRSFTALRTRLRPVVRHLELAALPVRTRSETRELDRSTSELIRQGVSLDELRTVGRVRDPEELAAQFYEKVITPKLTTRTEEATRPTRNELESKQTEIRSEETAKSTLSHRVNILQQSLAQKERVARREKEEGELIKKAGEAISKKPTRKIPNVEKSLRKDYLKVRKNVEAVDKDTKAVLAEIERARKEKDEETVRDLQKKYEDRQKELNEARAELKRATIEYGKYLKEVEEIEKEDKGTS